MKWDKLEAGDIVDIVAPSWRAPKGALEKGLKVIESWGFEPRVPKNIYGKDLLCANSKEARAEQLITALKARDSKAVWCLRGGAGASELLPFLEKIKRPLKPKPLIGLSDITALHTFINQKWHWPSLHGPMIEQLGEKKIKKSDEKELLKVLLGQQEKVVFNLKPMNLAARKRKNLRGQITGGNLVVMVSSLATAYQNKTKGHFLFFEEVGERGYRIDRLLNQLDQAGLFKSVSGIIFGDFIGCREKDGKDLTSKVLKRFAETQSVPVLKGLPCGHGQRQRPVPFGIPAALTLGDRPKLVTPSGGR